MDWPTTGTAKPPQKITSSEDLSGVVLDDRSAEYTGSWTSSNAQPSLLGTGYRHDDNTDRGKRVAKFTPNIPAVGEYEIRLLYT